MQKMLVISSEKESKTATKLDEWFTVGIFLFKTIHTFYMHCKFGFRIYKKKTHYFILFWIVKKLNKKLYCFKINCLLLVAVVEEVVFIFL